MKFHIIKLNDNVDNIAKEIKLHFLNKCNYIIIQNDKYLKNNEEDIRHFYELLNTKIGIIRNVDKTKYTDENQDNYWVDIKYKFNSTQIQPWKSNEHLKLHTDNTISTNLTYAQITELVCIDPCKYSGLTTIINNNYVIEIMKYVDENTNDNLFDLIYNREIYYTSDCKTHIKKTILQYDNENNNYIFSFNHTQAIKSDKNTLFEINIINKLNLFLEEKIMHSNLMDEIKLNTGDALLFNDELVIHGRRSVISNRHYKKCSIFI